METYDEDEIAFHEASHAVVDILHDLDVVDVIIYDELSSDPENLGHWGACHTNQCRLDHMTGKCLPGLLAGPISSMQWNLEWSDVHAKFVDMETVYSFAEGTDMYLAQESASLMYDGLRVPRMNPVVVQPKLEPKTVGVRRILEEMVPYVYTQFVMPHWDLIGKVSNQLLRKRRLTGAQVKQVMSRHLKRYRRKAIYL